MKKKKKVEAEQPDLEKVDLSEEGELDAEADELLDLDQTVEDTAEKELSLEEQVEFLSSALDEVTAKAEEYLDGWQRSRAEFANYKKRVLRENTEIHKVARGEVIKLYLDVMDDLERALLERPDTGDGKTWMDGIEIIVQKLRSRLEAEGVKPMNPLGEDFDPNLHEALMKEDSEEYESGKVIEVMQEGYWIGEKVLRPALVRVAA
jgi:molecular chaperone GrpE